MRKTSTTRNVGNTANPLLEKAQIEQLPQCGNNGEQHRCRMGTQSAVGGFELKLKLVAAIGAFFYLIYLTACPITQ